MAKDHEWQLGSGTSGGQWLLEDGMGQPPTEWDPLKGSPSKSKVPAGLPDDIEQAYVLGYKQAERDLTPQTFVQALKSELSGAAADTGLQVGRTLRNEWADAIKDLLNPEPPEPKEKSPSKLGQAAGFVGHAAWAGTKWAVRRGFGAARGAWENRKSKKTAKAERTDHLYLGDPNVIDGEWEEVPQDS